MSIERSMNRPLRNRRARQAGFTLMEVMVALVVFVISVVGLVSMEARSIEAQKAATEIRAAERIAQLEMAEITSRGFYDLLRVDFGGNVGPGFPYDDTAVPVAQRLRDHVRNFTTDGQGNTLGGVQNNFQVFRTVDMVVDGNAVPLVSNPPILPANDAAKWTEGSGGDLPNILGVEIEVLVLWVDRSNPAFPPPANAQAATLTPNMMNPLDANYAPWVGHVMLRTVRVNDALVNP